ncbi:hypothetical protein [Candidatus Hepatobacter penaei]|uniref:hypothetical protein n=1 Tax=Candidatus Hepatobacter penaei TaxID=1274402 RepID=UPI0012E019E7|nr:hypothetical protein [Candidatus Hepatobacter penaei]
MHTIQSRCLSWVAYASSLAFQSTPCLPGSLSSSCVLAVDHKLVGLSYAHDLLRHFRALQIRLMNGENIQDELARLRIQCADTPIQDPHLHDIITMLEIRLDLMAHGLEKP